MARPPRPTIQELAAAAGVSVATVDRVLNARTKVKAKTLKQVNEAAQRIGFYATGLIKARVSEAVPTRKLGFLLQRHSQQFYDGLATALTTATEASEAMNGTAIVEHVEDLSPANVAARLRALGERCEAVAVVAADHPYVAQAIADLRESGVPAITLLTELTAPERAGYAGLDWRKVGRTAGWAMSKLAGPKGKVAIILGSHRYQAQELAEMSFRSYLREHATELQLLEPVLTLEEPRLAYQGTLDLIQRNPDLLGVYMAGGGIEAVLQAFSEADLPRHVAIICHDLTTNSRAALIDGTIDLVISHPLEVLGRVTVGALVQAVESKAATTSGEVVGQSMPHYIVPLEIFTRENV